MIQSLAAAGQVALLFDESQREKRDGRLQVAPSLEVVERLIELALRPAPLVHVDRRLELAQIAVSTCEQLGSAGSTPTTTQATARALGCLADIERRRGHMQPAEAHLGRAHALLADAPDERTTAWLLGLDAAVFSDRGLWEDAIHVLGEAEALARAAGDGHLAADALIRRGVLYGWSESYETALETLTHAEQVSIDPAVYPRHSLLARHHRIWFILELGEIADALELWRVSHGRYRQFEHDSRIPFHRDWLEARLAYACKSMKAQALFSSIWTNSFVVGEPVPMIRLSMDLCKAYLHHGRFALGWQLLSRIIPLAQMWGMHRRGTEALALLRHSFGAQSATVEFVDRVGRYLHRGWWNPEIPFQ